jgi:hypothetical protein
MMVTLIVGDGIPFAISSSFAAPVVVPTGTVKLVIPVTLGPIARVEWPNVRA